MRAALSEVPSPSLAVLRGALPAGLFVAWVLLAYDTGVLDLGATKLAAFQAAASVWGMYAVVVGLAEPVRRPAVGLVLFVLAWATLPGILRGATGLELIEAPVYLACLTLTFVLLRRSLQLPRNWPGLIWCLTSLALVLSASTLIEALWLGGEQAFSGAPVVTLGNPNHLGAVLVLLMPAVLACIDRRGVLRPVVLGIAALTMAAIALTGSHLALFGAAALIGVAAALPMLTHSRRAIVVAVMIGATVGGHLLLDRVVIATPPSAASEPPGGIDRAFEGRVYLFERGLEVVASAPLLGVGIGEFDWAFALAQADHLEAHPDDLPYYTRLEHAHNDPLELLAEAGLVGLAALGLGLWLMRRAGAARPEPSDIDTGDLRGELVPLFALLGVALFVLISLGHFALYAPQVAVLGAMYLACLPGRRVALPGLVARVLLVVTLLLLALGAAITVRAYVAQRMLVQGLQALDAGDLEAADAALASAQRERPGGAVLFYRGTLALERGAIEDAVELLGAAAYLLPYAEVHHNYAVALCALGEHERALERFDQALRLDPRHVESARARAACARDAATATESEPPSAAP